MDYSYVLFVFIFLVLVWVVYRLVSKHGGSVKTSPGFEPPTTGSAIQLKRTGKSPLSRDKRMED
jgi:hypothetical protein